MDAILNNAIGFNIVDERGCYLLDAKEAGEHASSSTGFVKPVMTNEAAGKVAQGLGKAMVKEGEKNETRKKY